MTLPDTICTASPVNMPVNMPSPFWVREGIVPTRKESILWWHVTKYVTFIQVPEWYSLFLQPSATCIKELYWTSYSCAFIMGTWDVSELYTSDLVHMSYVHACHWIESRLESKHEIVTHVHASNSNVLHTSNIHTHNNKSVLHIHASTYLNTWL